MLYFNRNTRYILTSIGGVLFALKPSAPGCGALGQGFSRGCSVLLGHVVADDASMASNHVNNHEV